MNKAINRANNYLKRTVENNTGIFGEGTGEFSWVETPTAVKMLNDPSMGLTILDDFQSDGSCIGRAQCPGKVARAYTYA